MNLLMRLRVDWLLVLILTHVSLFGQILVTSYSQGTVALYDFSGALINASFISGLNQPTHLALDVEGNIYVVNSKNNTVGKYTISGQTVNAALFQTVSSGFYSMSGIAIDASGNIFVVQSMGSANVAVYTTSGAMVQDPLINLTSTGPRGLALDGLGNLYVAKNSSGTVGKYTTSGTTVNHSLITGLNGPSSVAVDPDGYLFVASFDGTIGKYNLDGSPLNRALISGLRGPSSIALDGKGHLFVVESYVGRIGEYTTSGEPVNASLISGLTNAWGIAIIPEPPPLPLASAALVLFGLRRAVQKPLTNLLYYKRSSRAQITQ